MLFLFAQKDIFENMKQPISNSQLYRIGFTIVSFFLTCVSSLLPTTTHAAITLQTIAHSEYVPAELGLEPGSFSSLSGIGIADSGDFVYQALFQPEAGGSRVEMLVKGMASSQQILVKKGDDAPNPGFDDEFSSGYQGEFNSFRLPEINAAGEMVIYATTSGGEGIWKADTAGSIHYVAMHGQTVPGTNQFYADFEKFHIGNTGDILFQPFLEDLDSGETEISIWSTNGELHRAYRPGDPITGLDPTAELNNAFQVMNLDEHGNTKIVSFFEGGSPSDFGYFSETAGVTSFVWKDFDPVPGTVASLALNPTMIDRGSWNRSGQLIFNTRLYPIDDEFISTTGVFCFRA